MRRLRRFSAALHCGDNDAPRPPSARSPLDPSLERVRAIVADAATTADEIARALAESAHAVAAALVELELLGLVEEVDGVYRATP